MGLTFWRNKLKIHLNDVGVNKIAVIKVIREYTGLGLKDSKHMVDIAPTVIDCAEFRLESGTVPRFMQDLRDVGAVVECPNVVTTLEIRNTLKDLMITALDTDDVELLDALRPAYNLLSKRMG